MKITLYYFDLPFWRAEVSRLALYIGNIPFIDYRINDDEYKIFKIEGETFFRKIEEKIALIFLSLNAIAGLFIGVDLSFFAIFFVKLLLIS